MIVVWLWQWRLKNTLAENKRTSRLWVKHSTGKAAEAVVTLKPGVRIQLIKCKVWLEMHSVCVCVCTTIYGFADKPPVKRWKTDISHWKKKCIFFLLNVNKNTWFNTDVDYCRSNLQLLASFYLLNNDISFCPFIVTLDVVEWCRSSWLHSRCRSYKV